MIIIDKENYNYNSKIILQFIKFNKDNNNKKYLLTLDEIKALSSIYVEDSSNYISLWKYFDSRNIEEIEHLNNEDEEVGGTISISSNDNEREKFFNLNEDEKSMNDDKVILKNN